MNYDPWEFCFECHRIRPKHSMGWASPNKKRRACDECIDRINGLRDAAKEKAKEGKR